MKTKLLPVCFIAVAFSLAVFLASSCAAQVPPKAEKIGVYESRAVALAYGRSTQHNEMISKLIADAKKAKADGDNTTYDKLKKQIEQHQEQMEYQVFSDRRIDDVIKVIEPALADLKQKTRVERIVDKRDAPKNSATVDVTWQLVQQFHPTDKTVQMINDLLKHPPVKHVPKH